MIYQKEENKKGKVIVVGSDDRHDVVQRIKEGTFNSALVQDNGFTKAIIWNLALHEIPFTKVSYGSGVYLIMKEERMSVKVNPC